MIFFLTEVESILLLYYYIVRIFKNTKYKIQLYIRSDRAQLTSHQKIYRVMSHFVRLSQTVL